ncbi:MAG: sugar phosphate isomerase/epimerase family protein [Lentisphaeria bacterium]
MELKLLKCDWGMEYLGDPSERLHKYKEAGYDGVECANIGMEPEEFSDLMGELDLDYVAMMFCDDEQAFRDQLEDVKKTRPILVNCHPGRDWFSHERGVEFFRNVMEMAGEVDVQVVYETHRTRCLYSPWATAKYLEAIPELRICADFSHFTTVAEGDMTLPPYSDFMDIAIARTDHIHARVGYVHGPQVPDARVGEGLQWTEHFEQWWDRIIAERQAEGRQFVTINPEFGPPLYQPFDPVTREPLADIWEICLFITQRFRQRWADRL